MSGNKYNHLTTKTVAILAYAIIAAVVRYLVIIYKPFATFPAVGHEVYSILTGVGPLVAAILVIAVFKRKMEYSTFGVSVKRSLLSAVIPVGLFFFYDLLAGNNSFSNTVVASTCLVYAYCEEFGWRGYLQSELIGLPTFKRVSIITVIWFLWHLDWRFDLNGVIFLAILFFGSWGIGQIAIKSKSIIACACFHAIMNFVQNMQMGIIPVVLIGISVISWFVIWYYKIPMRFAGRAVSRS